MSSTSIDSHIQTYPEGIQPILHTYWQNWLGACERHQCDVQIEDLAALLDVWCCSDFIARECIKRPMLLQQLLSEGLEQKRTAETYRQSLQDLISNTSNDDELMRLLRQYRNFELVRIAWRDLQKLADTTQILCELSWLADACISVTLEILYQDSCEKIGTPVNSSGEAIRPVVFGMGKLGAYELNFSSDIDLIFFYSEQGETVGKRVLANSEFLTRLMQRFINVLNKATIDGFVYRVDTRLRPFGDSGPLVMSFAGVENYYQTQGRSWERYAMIKARAIYGEQKDIHELIQILKPFVFRRYLDFGAFASIRKMKKLIENEISRKGLQHNIKLGEGGIREIEFIGQTFQLIRGGREPELQVRGIVDVLNLLGELNDLPGETVRELLDSYDFLRQLENKLQIFGDEQTHLMPSDEVVQQRICQAMKAESWTQLSELTLLHRKRVHEHFDKVFSSSELGESEDSEDDFYHTLWVGQFDEETALEKLTERGFYCAREIWALVSEFAANKMINRIGDSARQRLDKLVPLMLSAIEKQPQPDVVLARLLEIVQAILKRSVYIALLIEYPMALTQLVKLCASSVLITRLLTKYPLLLDDLLDPSHLYHLPTKLEMEQQLDIEASRHDEDDLEAQMDVLRHFKHSQILKIAALDVAGDINVFDISSQLTRLAELILNRVYQIAWMDMVEKHGHPLCRDEKGIYYPQLSIIAYGKMGGQELGYNSDLDIVFLHDSHGEQQMTDGERSVDNNVFFSRMTQRIIHILSSYTNAGRLYEVDTRLRPDGNKGLLVSNLNSFEQYQVNQAWTWEHQALLRARIVVSNTQTASEFDRIRRSVLSQARDREKLLQDVREMRHKMRDHLGNKAEDGRFQLKQDAGGLVDIEFITQYSVLANAAIYPALLDFSSTIELIDRLEETGCWEAERAKTLIECYRFYRDLTHQRALDEADLLFDESEVQECRQKVRAIWSEVLLEQI